MALGFLGDLFDDFDIGDVLDLGKAAVGIAGMFDKQELPKDVRQAVSFNQDISNALMNPDDPMFTRLVDQETGQINRDFAEGLRQLMISDRRARARGVGMLNPERRDEALAQATGRNRAGAGDQARAAARAYLMNAANVNNAAFNMAQPMIALDATNRANKAGGIEGLFDVGQRLLNGDPSGTPAQTFNINLGQQQRSNLPSIHRTGGY